MKNKLLDLKKGDFVETADNEQELKLVIYVRKNVQIVYLQSFSGEMQRELCPIDWLSERVTRIIRSTDPSWAALARKFLTE
ncbi:MAG: hypothetical protein Q7R98_01795 [Candidatus Jorgensenbacteria bacterium]|nr:hypothetical protein [Candidatus Jorgensenbacteria bacterium]